jgi:long-chain fatty acid transport protein
MWQPVDTLYIGASYQSQPGFGSTKQDGELRNRVGGAEPTVSDIFLEQELPDVVRLGARYRPSDGYEVRLSGDYTRWSVFERQCLLDATNPDAYCALDDDGGVVDPNAGVVVNQERDWRDTFGVKLGGSMWIDRDFEIAGSVAYDSSAVPLSTLDVGLMDMNKVIGTAGLRMRLATILWTLSYSHVYYMKRTSQTKTPPPAPSAVPDGAGTYRQQIGLVNLGAQIDF